jgi:hypothetical protein
MELPSMKGRRILSLDIGYSLLDIGYSSDRNTNRKKDE